MSRVGKKPIFIPEKTTINVDSTTNKVYIKGKLGENSLPLFKDISIMIKDSAVFLSQNSDKNTACLGLFHTILKNKILGVNEFFRNILLLEGVGYKVLLKDSILEFFLGYSHPIHIAIPKEIHCEIISPIKLKLSAIDKEALGTFTAKLKHLRKLDPYKGKGIRLEGEFLKLKEGKKHKK